MKPIFKLLLSLAAGFQSLELSAADTSNGWQRTLSDGVSPSLHAGTWKRLPDLPDPIGVAGAFAGVSDGALIVAGGANFPDAPPWEGGKKVWHDTIWALGAPDGEWKRMGKLPRPIAYGVIASSDSVVICLGGSDADHHYPDAFGILVPRLEDVVYSRMARAPNSFANACGSLVGNSLYIAGGTDSPSSTSARTNFYSLSSLKWESRWKELPSWPGPARQLAVAGSDEKSFYLCGGTALAPDAEGKPVRTYLRDAYAFDPSSNRWRRIADLPFPLAASPSPAATVNGKLVIFGGDDAPSADPKTHKGFRDEMLEYDPATDKWTIIGHMPAPRATAPVVRWQNGYVIISGEVRRGVRSREVWMWTP